MFPIPFTSLSQTGEAWSFHGHSQNTTSLLYIIKQIIVSIIYSHRKEQKKSQTKPQLTSSRTAHEKQQKGNQITTDNNCKTKQERRNHRPTKLNKTITTITTENKKKPQTITKPNGKLFRKTEKGKTHHSVRSEV